MFILANRNKVWFTVDTIIIIPWVIVVGPIHVVVLLFHQLLVPLGGCIMLHEIQINLLEIMVPQKVHERATDGLRDSLLQLQQAHRRVHSNFLRLIMGTMAWHAIRSISPI